MAIRQARAEDMPAVRALADRYGLTGEWPRRPDWIDHLLEQRGLWIDAEDGRAAGFAGVLADGGITHLTDLFIDPDALGRGTGKALLAAAFPAGGARTTFASGDPRALPLYTRAGLRPLAPLLYLAGPLHGTGAVAERIAVEAVPAGRPGALAFLAAAAGAYGLRAGEGSAVVRPVPGGALLGPAVAGSADLLALAGAVAAAHGTVKVAIPGPHPALQPLLEAGLRIKDADTYMASVPGVDDLERRIPHPDLG
jgi:GNAT superfamily N-acetyltransferase